MNLFGTTRTVVRDRHALIAPDSHVPSAFPGWTSVTAIVQISPAMGACLTQMLLKFQADQSCAKFPADENQHAFFVLDGNGTLTNAKEVHILKPGDFAFLPAETGFEILGSAGLNLCLFRMDHEPLAGYPAPEVIVGSSADVASQPFLGNPRAVLQSLLPDESGWDFAMNLFTYQPGATLPFVETHIMEHGLLMLDGQGVYRLEESYYPVKAGDAIWMAPYCPQWFVAMGDTPARYLYCKNVNRLP